MSTEALLDLFGAREPQRTELLARRRPESVRLVDPVLGEATVRDNGPLHEGKLAASLVDMTVEGYLRMLNHHVFFWPRRERLVDLLGARAYRERSHLILEIETATLVAAHGPAVRLSPINSGATVFQAQPRGSSTFADIVDYDFEEWKSRRTRSTAIAEVCVAYAVPDIVQHVRRVTLWHPGGAEVEVVTE